ncbi:hypothetical protein TB1_032377 [Malus domestica]
MENRVLFFAATTFSLLLLLLLPHPSTAASATAAASPPLSSTFYHATCPRATSVIRAVVQRAVAGEPRLGASLLRMHFHDCFVQGCDGSVLLDDTGAVEGEKGTPPNKNSLRGFQVVDAAKSELEHVCPGVVSCADTLAVAAREGVVAVGGPSWDLLLGRRDSLAPNASATIELPGPDSPLAGLREMFAAKGFTEAEMVALSGAHTIGRSSCRFFRGRIYNDANMDREYAARLQTACPPVGGDLTVAPLDPRSPDMFDNAYYGNLVERKGLFRSDQALFGGGGGNAVEEQVLRYSRNLSAFEADFAAAMQKMSALSPLTGGQGEVRVNCRRVNPAVE